MAAEQGRLILKKEQRDLNRQANMAGKQIGKKAVSLWASAQICPWTTQVFWNPRQLSLSADSGSVMADRTALNMNLAGHARLTVETGPATKDLNLAGEAPRVAVH
jgi:hypothetical protein